jgi:membrane associated rhomboid family serine protease
MDLAPAPRSTNRVLPAHPFAAAVFMLAFTALLYVVEFVDQLTGQRLDYEGGILSRRLDGLDGILWAPFLHANWAHLWANTVPFLVFGFFAMAAGTKKFFGVTAVIWLTSGIGVWLLGPGSPYVTIGASGVIFGWLVFLLVRGFFARSGAQIALAVVFFVIWGGVLWGILPGDEGISWQAHLFGALGGLLAASLFARRPPRPAVAPPAF